MVFGLTSLLALANSSYVEQKPSTCDVTLLMVRHGERIDETLAQWSFRSACAEGKVWIGDPWLSQPGEEKAEKTANYVQQSLGPNQNFVKRVYSSPLQRCVRTAEPFAQALGKPIEVVDGLSALEKQVHNMGLKPETMRRTDWYKGHYQKKENIQYHTEPEQPDKDFWGTVNRLARQECGPDGRGTVLLVTHRESIGAGCKAAGLSCDVAAFASVTGFQYKLGENDKMMGKARLVLPTTTHTFDPKFLKMATAAGVDDVYKHQTKRQKGIKFGKFLGKPVRR